jgi:hypothetical protein
MTRWLNVALRTAHIGAMGVLVGGHAFDVAPERLRVVLWLTIGTGVALAALEAGPRLLWFHQGSGLMTMAKVALLCAVPLAWDFRLPILLTVILIASVGSHMPGRYRHYSVLYRKVIHDVSGPGGKRGGEDGLNGNGPSEGQGST